MKRLTIIIFLTLTINQIGLTQSRENRVYIKVDSIPEFVYSDCNNTKSCIELYVKTNAQWPTDDDIIVTIYIQCIVEKNGKLTNFKVIRGLDEIYDKASIDILKSMPLWKPGMIKEKIVRTQITIPVKWDFLRTSI